MAADAVFFGFEADFVGSLRCIPMAARLRLDLSGIKLKLNEWSKLDREVRAEAAGLPCGDSAAIDAYRTVLTARVAQACGAAPSLLSQLPTREWEDASRVPAQVADQAAANGRALSPDVWSRLTGLQRFALIKLSRPGHENLNFLPACDEFGISG